MKRFLFPLLGTAFFMAVYSLPLQAQTDSDDSALTASTVDLGDLDARDAASEISIQLGKILQLHGPEDLSVAFTFDELEEFRQGIWAEDPTNDGKYFTAGVRNGVQQFGVDATVNWKLDWRADLPADYVAAVQGVFVPEEERLSLNNVGALIKMGNKHSMSIDEGPIALTKDDHTIIKRVEGKDNIGDAEANAFTLYWRMGTREQPKNPGTPAMNTLSLLEQQIQTQTFKFSVIFTLSQEEPWDE